MIDQTHPREAARCAKARKAGSVCGRGEYGEEETQLERAMREEQKKTTALN